MKRKSIKVAAVVISIVIFCTMFSACGGKKSTGNDASGSKANVTQGNTKKDDGLSKYEPKAGKAYEISFLTYGYGPCSPDSDIVKKYNETFNVKLKPDFIDSNKWDDLLNIKFASNEVPDVIPCKSPDRLAKYVSQKLLTDIPVELINKYAPDVVKTVNKEAPKSWGVAKIDGKLYGIPYINGATYNYHDAIIWRDDWLKNVGITKIPETIQEFEDAFIKFTKNDPDKNGKNDTYGLSSSGFSTIFGAYGVICYVNDKDAGRASKVYWREQDGQMLYGAIQPGAKKALELLARWYKMGLIDPEFITGENKGGHWAITHDFVNGRIGYTQHTGMTSWLKNIQGSSDGTNAKELAKINPNATYAFGQPPIGPDGKTRGAGKIGNASGLSYVFSKNLEKEPDKIGKILQMFNWPAEKPENWLFNWGGVEGKTYEMKQIGEYKIPSRTVTDYAKQADVGLSSFFFIFDAENNKKLFPYFFKFADSMNYANYAVQNDLLVPLPSSSKYSAELEKMREETFIKIICGEKPIEYFDEFVQKWKQNGGDQLVKEANEYLKNSK